MMYSPSPTTETNWCGVRIWSVEPISLVERGNQLPSVNEVDGLGEEEESDLVRGSLEVSRKDVVVVIVGID
jgi:hypothetical protein